ncbi:MAG: hypothetical protein U9M89_00930 [Patescibacteria group bacterium]|nr:hypothetical protein [Patescibacteria group bacterium]
MKPKEIDLGFKVYESDLYKLDLSAERMGMSELMVNADIPYLEQEDTDDWNLSPSQLIKNWDREITHSARVEAADLDYPIMIYFFRGEWIILDGVHRFTKALMEGREFIMVKKVSDGIVATLRQLEES